MASVKKLKSKGMAAPSSGVYESRKLAFSEQPAAKIVKPVRYCRRVYEQALAAWDRAIRAGANAVFPEREQYIWRLAISCQGHPAVQSLARIA